MSADSIEYSTGAYCRHCWGISFGYLDCATVPLNLRIRELEREVDRLNRQSIARRIEALLPEAKDSP